MNIFVAGGSGTIGVPLVRALVARGHVYGPNVRPALGALERQGAPGTGLGSDGPDLPEGLAPHDFSRRLIE